MLTERALEMRQRMETHGTDFLTSKLEEYEHECKLQIETASIKVAILQERITTIHVILAERMNTNQG